MSARSNPAFAATAYGLVWRRRSLLSAIPEITAVTTPERMVGDVLRRARARLKADTASLSLRDARTGRFRIVAVAHADSAATRWPAAVHGLAANVPPTWNPATEDLVFVPADDPQRWLAFALDPRGGIALVAALRYGDEVVGALTAVRSLAFPFRATDRSLASRIAADASLVLTTVRFA